jgi:hypothetical protein
MTLSDMPTWAIFLYTLILLLLFGGGFLYFFGWVYLLIIKRWLALDRPPRFTFSLVRPRRLGMTRGWVAALISVVVVVIWTMVIDYFQPPETPAARWPDLAQVFGTNAEENGCIIRQAVRLRPVRQDFAVSARAMCEGVAECIQYAKERDHDFSANLGDDGVVHMRYSRFMTPAGPDSFRRCVKQHGYTLSPP